MVRGIILSEYSATPPDDGGRAKIDTPAPLYELGRVQKLLADESALVVWTQKCRKDVLNLFDGDHERVIDLVLSLHASNYIDSEWCDNGKGAVAACDAYRIQRQELISATGRHMTIEYYLKFAIGKTGRLVLLVSCHV